MGLYPRACQGSALLEPRSPNPFPVSLYFTHAVPPGPRVGVSGAQPLLHRLLCPLKAQVQQATAAWTRGWKLPIRNYFDLCVNKVNLHCRARGNFTYQVEKCVLVDGVKCRSDTAHQGWLSSWSRCRARPRPPPRARPSGQGDPPHGTSPSGAQDRSHPTAGLRWPGAGAGSREGRQERRLPVLDSSATLG